MEAPPYLPGTPKKSNTGLIIGGIVLALMLCCCGICGVGGYMGKNVFGKAIGFAACGQAMGQNRDAILLYAAAHGDSLPPANTWQDSIKPYLKVDPSAKEMETFVKVPGPNDDFCDSGAGTAITMNETLGGKKLAGIKDQMGTILLFETQGKGRNKSAAWKEPSFSTSPVLMSNERRGWIRQPLSGAAGAIDKRGTLTPLPDMKSRKAGSAGE